MYGDAHRQHRSTLLVDSIVCTLLSERKLGPQVSGIFADGRVEEFIEVSRTQRLTTSELSWFYPVGGTEFCNGDLLADACVCVCVGEKNYFFYVGGNIISFGNSK